jgi:hypothetical protein
VIPCPELCGVSAWLVEAVWDAGGVHSIIQAELVSLHKQHGRKSLPCCLLRYTSRLNLGVMRPSALVLRRRAAIGSCVCCPAPGSWALAGRRASGRQWTFRAGAPAGHSSARVPSSLLAAHRPGLRGGAWGSSASGWHKRRRGSASGALTRPVARVSDTLPHNKSFKPKPLRGSA